MVPVGEDGEERTTRSMGTALCPVVVDNTGCHDTHHGMTSWSCTRSPKPNPNILYVKTPNTPASAPLCDPTFSRDTATVSRCASASKSLVAMPGPPPQRAPPSSCPAPVALSLVRLEGPVEGPSPVSLLCVARGWLPRRLPFTGGGAVAVGPVPAPPASPSSAGYCACSSNHILYIWGVLVVCTCVVGMAHTQLSLCTTHHHTPHPPNNTCNH